MNKEESPERTQTSTRPKRKAPTRRYAAISRACSKRQGPVRDTTDEWPPMLEGSRLDALVDQLLTCSVCSTRGRSSARLESPPPRDEISRLVGILQTRCQLRDSMPKRPWSLSLSFVLGPAIKKRFVSPRPQRLARSRNRSLVRGAPFPTLRQTAQRKVPKPNPASRRRAVA